MDYLVKIRSVQTPLNGQFSIGANKGSLKDKVREALLGKTITQCGFFNNSFIEQMVDQHQSGLRDYSSAIWSLLMFEAFLRNNM